jgi:small-conductance mechanosensitive channel
VHIFAIKNNIIFVINVVTLFVSYIISISIVICHMPGNFRISFSYMCKVIPLFIWELTVMWISNYDSEKDGYNVYQNKVF